VRSSALRFLPFLALLLPPSPRYSAEELIDLSARLYDLDTSRFPEVSVFLSLTDPLGGRPGGLTEDGITLEEDQHAVGDLAVAEEPTGFRLVAVVDPGPDLLRLLPEGESRLDRLRRAVADWLGPMPYNDLDDLTLITPEGMPVAHSNQAGAFLDALRTYSGKTPAAPVLDALLEQALNAAADPMPRDGMRSILMVFSASNPNAAGGLSPLVCPRALELDTPVYGVWSGRVQPSTKRDYESLAALATACGGYSVALENASGLGTLLGNLATQREQYRLEYRSRAAFSGEHFLQAAVLGGFSAQIEPLTFPLDVRPPVVAWLKFPADVIRKPGDPLQPAEEFQPDSADFEAEISFPDGHPRAISSIRLLADGQPVSDCPAPCSGIRWSIRNVTENTTFGLELVILDELGLEGRTESRPLAIEVLHPAPWDVFRVKYLAPVSIVAALILAGGMLVFAIAVMSRGGFAGGRSKPITPDLLFPPGGKRQNGLRERWRQWNLKRKAGRGGKGTDAEFTYLILEPLGPGTAALEITAADAVIGRDPDCAAVVNDPSVSPRHARIACMPDGTPWIFDLGSGAGTWKNFDEAPREGCALREGDRINFGRASFRVRLRLRPPARPNGG
jgi:hypothetical protein